MSLDACVRLLETLVGHRTNNPGGDEPALAALLGERLEALGADTVEVIEIPRDGEIGAYVWATWGEPKLLLNVHLDTVPVADGWTRDPFTLTRDDNGLLYGLGSADTKGAIAAILTALGQRRPENLAVLFSGDEERGTTVMREFLRSGKSASIERAIVCEPTRRRAGVRHRGIRAYRVEIPGVGGHSSRADYTTKPLVLASRLAIELDQLGEAYLERDQNDGAELPGLCLNIAGIAGGQAFNVIPQRAALTFSVRPPPEFEAERFEGEIGTCLRAVARNMTVETVLARAPFETRDRTPFETLLGTYPQSWGDLDFWTEAAYLSEAGIDAVVIGPGDIAVAHGPDEHVSVVDLEWAITMFASLLALV